MSETLIEKFERLLSDLHEEKKTFTDSQFPADKFSLIQDWKKSPLATAWKLIEFKPAAALFPRAYELFVGKIDPTKIKQGVLEDVYFLSAFMALAEYPSLVLKLFYKTEKNESGCYLIWICDSGEWKGISVDEMLPGTPEKQVAFSRSVSNEIWVSLLEKAYAKVYRGYQNIVTGCYEHALHDLTGAPYQRHRLEQDPMEVWTALGKYMEKGYLLGAYMKNKKKEEKAAESAGYVYSVLDIRELTLPSTGATVRLIKLRNVWKKWEWTGDWSASSNKWTENLKKILAYNPNDSSIIWMTLADFCKQFSSYSVLKVHEGYYYTSCRVAHSILQPSQSNIDHSAFFFRVQDSPLHVFASINQKDLRQFREAAPSVYSYARILISKVTADGLEYCFGHAAEDRNVFCEGICEPGEYLCIVEIHWKLKEGRVFNVGFYSERKLSVASISSLDVIAAYRDLFRNLAIRRDVVEQNTRSYIAQGEPNAEVVNGQCCGIIYFYYQNYSKDRTKITEEVKLKHPQNIQICPPQPSTDFSVTLPPGSNNIVLFRCSAEDYDYVADIKSTVTPLKDQKDEPGKTILPFILNQRTLTQGAFNDNYNNFVKKEYNHVGFYHELIEKRSVVGQQNPDLKFAPFDARASFLSKSSKMPMTDLKPKLPMTLGGERVAGAFNLERCETKHKKIMYTNYLNEDKELLLEADRPDILQLKKNAIMVPMKQTTYIRFELAAPDTRGKYSVRLYITNKLTKKIEEIIIFDLNVS